jgi:hypothetical protein
MHEKLHICIKFTGSATLLLFCSVMSVKLMILISTYIHIIDEVELLYLVPVRNLCLRLVILKNLACLTPHRNGISHPRLGTADLMGCYIRNFLSPYMRLYAPSPSLFGDLTCADGPIEMIEKGK